MYTKILQISTNPWRNKVHKYVQFCVKEWVFRWLLRSRVSRGCSWEGIAQMSLKSWLKFVKIELYTEKSSTLTFMPDKCPFSKKHQLQSFGEPLINSLRGRVTNFLQYVAPCLLADPCAMILFVPSNGNFYLIEIGWIFIYY